MAVVGTDCHLEVILAKPLDCVSQLDRLQVLFKGGEAL